MKKTVFHIVVLMQLGASLAYGVLSDVTHQTMEEVIKIARAIAVVQPFLDDTKLMEYGLGIYRASKKYDIDPIVLISIAQQETSFRENMAEGAAGEIGICQIRKAWLKHPAFKAEFKNAKIKDIKKPAKSFMMAAWILKDLKARGTASRTLPFWSFYNSVKFENRFKYFLLVNKNIAAVRKYLTGVAKVLEAAMDPAEPTKQTIPAELEPAVPARQQSQVQAASPPPQRAPTAVQPQPAPMQGRWISDAMQKLQEKGPSAPVKSRASGPTADNVRPANGLRAQINALSASPVSAGIPD